MVHSISFQTIFLQAFKIVVDSWEFTILLLYILWDDWPIFIISGSNQQLQQQLEYTLLNWHAHIRGLPWSLPEVVGTVQQVHCSRRRLLRRGLEFLLCTINKSAHTKNVWKLIRMHLVYCWIGPVMSKTPLCEFVYCGIYVFSKTKLIDSSRLRIWFGWVLRHINHCWLFNTQILYIYIYIYIYILYIYIYIYMIGKHILLKIFLNEPDLIFFCTQLSGFTYFYVIWIILFTINHLFAHS